MLTNIKLTLLCLTFSLSLVSCISEGTGRKGRKSVEDFSISSGEEVTEEVVVCTDLYQLSTDSCLTECPTNTHEAEPAERQQIRDDFLAENNNDLTDNPEAQRILNDIDSARNLCADGTGVTRPDQEVFIEKGFCSCLNGQPDIINNDCTSFCAGTNTTVPTLFVSTTLGPNIELNPELGNLFNWCTKEIDDGLVSPSCTLEAFDGLRTENLEVALSSSNNSFSANVGTLQLDKTYVLKLVESGSGSNARSKSFQIKRTAPTSNNPTPAGPAKIMNINMYSCFNLAGSQTADNFDSENVIRTHFIFPTNSSPPTLPPGDDSNIFCHDVNRFGRNDNPEFPRLETIAQHFNLWDESDIRFFDQTGTGNEDINDTFIQNLQNNHGVSVDPSTRFFFHLRAANFPFAETQPRIGYALLPFVDPDSGLAFCPNQQRYQSSDPFMIELKDLIEVDTEGIYLALKEPEVLRDSQGNEVNAPNDVIFIREGLLKQIWFYIEDGRHVEPTEVTAGQKTIMFYWPADTENPFVKKSQQRVYTVRTQEEITNITGNGNDDDNVRTNVRPSDRRFACIPAVD